jgi:hypothetical protein
MGIDEIHPCQLSLKLNGLGEVECACAVMRQRKWGT